MCHGGESESIVEDGLEEPQRGQDKSDNMGSNPWRTVIYSTASSPVKLCWLLSCTLEKVSPAVQYVLVLLDCYSGFIGQRERRNGDLLR